MRIERKNGNVNMKECIRMRKKNEYEKKEKRKPNRKKK